MNINYKLHAMTSVGKIILTESSAGTWKNKQLSLSVKVKEDSAYKVIFAEIRNIGDIDIFIDEIEILDISFPENDELSFMRFGFNMPGDPVLFGRISKEGFHPAVLPADAAFCGENDDAFYLSSNTLIALKQSRGHDVLVLGAGSFNVTEGTICLNVKKADGQISLTYKMVMDGIKIPCGTSKKLDSILMVESGNLNSALTTWAKKTASETGCRIPDKIPTGWNDWQYYRNEKTQRDVLDSAEVIAMLRNQGYPLDFIQIDGGFCMHLSEWDKPTASFDLGLGRISEMINSMGLKFGLWFAPYIQNVNTTVVKEHPEWLLKDESGEILRLENSNVGASCLIDYTCNDACEWLKKQITRFVAEWNVKWIKLDGPNYALYRKGRLNERNTTIHEMLVRTFKIMRAAAGEDVLIEGEGPMGLALGSVDMQRVQTDNHPVWHTDGNSKRPYAPCVYGKELSMAFLHGRWWCNHRENVILRDYSSPFCAAKSRNPDVMESVFSENEIQTQLVSTLMSPGGLLLTDPMKELIRNSGRMEYIHQILPVWNQAAEIIDEFPENSRFPSLYKMEINLPYETYFLVSAVNWSDKTADFKVTEKQITGKDGKTDYFAFSFFDRKASEFAGVFDIRNVPAHGTKLFAIRKKLPHPQLISTDMHMSQGAIELKSHEWNEPEKNLEIKINHFYQLEARLFLHVPDDWKIQNIETNAVRFYINDFEKEYPVMIFDGSVDKETAFRIFFIKVEKNAGEPKLNRTINQTRVFS